MQFLGFSFSHDGKAIRDMRKKKGAGTTILHRGLANPTTRKVALRPKVVMPYSTTYLQVKTHLSLVVEKFTIGFTNGRKNFGAA